MARLDRTNQRILEVLQQNARATLAEMAAAVDRAETTVRDRVIALERDGYLRGYRAEVNYEKLGYRAHAIVRAEADFARLPEIVDKVKQVPQVRSLYITTGRRPIRLEVWMEDAKQLTRLFQRRLAPLGLHDFEVSMVVDRVLPRRPLPIPDAAIQDRPTKTRRSAAPPPLALQTER